MKILIAIHPQIVRDGIQRILADDPDIIVSGVAENRDELYSLGMEQDVDIFIIDVDLPGLDVINTVSEVHKNYPNTNVLAISNEEEPTRIKSILQAGASGFMFKKRGAEELIKASKDIYQGNKYLCEEAIKLLIHKDATAESVENSANLTKREQEVLHLICEEYINREIADKLGISVRTVDAHRRNLLQKTGAQNTAGLVKYAIRHQLFEL